MCRHGWRRTGLRPGGQYDVLRSAGRAGELLGALNPVKGEVRLGFQANRSGARRHSGPAVPEPSSPCTTTSTAGGLAGPRRGHLSPPRIWPGSNGRSGGRVSFTCKAGLRAEPRRAGQGQPWPVVETELLCEVSVLRRQYAPASGFSPRSDTGAWATSRHLEVSRPAHRSEAKSLAEPNGRLGPGTRPHRPVRSRGADEQRAERSRVDALRHANHLRTAFSERCVESSGYRKGAENGILRIRRDRADSSIRASSFPSPGRWAVSFGVATLSTGAVALRCRVAEFGVARSNTAPASRERTCPQRL